MSFYFNPGRLSKSRLKVFIAQVNTNGGNVVNSHDSATHIICEESCDLNALPTSFWENKRFVVGSLWLSNCIKKNVIVDLQSYTINKPLLKCKSNSPDQEGAKPKKPLNLNTKSDDSQVSDDSSVIYW